MEVRRRVMCSRSVLSMRGVCVTGNSCAAICPTCIVDKTDALDMTTLDPSDSRMARCRQLTDMCLAQVDEEARAYPERKTAFETARKRYGVLARPSLYRGLKVDEHRQVCPIVGMTSWVNICCVRVCLTFNTWP